MKSFKKSASAIFALLLVFSLLFIPASAVNAYTVGRATLNVTDHSAYAATDDIGYVDVGLQIMFTDTTTGKIYDNGTQASADSGHVEVYLSSGWYTNIITYARSYHGNGNSTMALTWDSLNGYSYSY
jgi:hypothetical protein